MGRIAACGCGGPALRKSDLAAADAAGRSGWSFGLAVGLCPTWQPLLHKQSALCRLTSTHIIWAPVGHQRQADDPSALGYNAHSS